MEFFLLYLLMFGVFILIGHGLWLLLARALRALKDILGVSESARVHSQRGRCPDCGARLPSWHAPCEACELRNETSRIAEVRELRATIRQLRRLREHNVAEAPSIERALGCVALRLEALTRMPVPQPTAPIPDVLPVIPLAEAAPVEVESVVPLQEQAHEFIEVCKDVREVAEEKKNRIANWFQRHTSEPEVIAEESDTGVEIVPGLIVVEEVKPAEARPPRRSVAEMLGAFMQESNIVWGEILAGLVMVGSSVALVISLWTTLEQTVPYFPFLIFSAITAAVFGAGFYSLHHWKLESTSRGLLTIAALLVPLNFLVMAGLLVQHGPVPVGIDLFRLGSEAAAIGIFAWLLLRAGRVLTPGGEWPLALAIVWVSASALSIPRLLTTDHTDAWRSFLTELLPVVGFVATGGIMIRKSLPAEDTQATKGLLAFFGMAVFPLILVLGFQAYWTREIGIDIREGFRRLALLLPVAAAPLLAGGFRIHKCLPRDTGASLGSLRTAGTAIGFCGMALMLAAVPLSWPGPWTTALVGVFNFLVLTWLAFWLELPLVHVAALPCLTVGYLVAFHQLPESWFGNAGNPRVLGLGTTTTSFGLFSLTVLLTGAVELLDRFRKSHAFYYGLGDAVLVVVNLVLINLLGFAHPGQAAVLTGLYAAGGLLGNLRWRRSTIDFVSVGLLPVATLWAFQSRFNGVTPYAGLALALESLALALIAVMGRSVLRTPLAWRLGAPGVAILALGCSVVAWGMPPTELPAIVLAILAATFLVLSSAHELVALTWIGAALLLGSLLDIATWPWPQAHFNGASSFAFLIHASLAVLTSIGLLFESNLEGRANRLYGIPLRWIALTSAALAPLGLLTSPEISMSLLAVITAWMALIWLVIAILAESALLFCAAQMVASAAAICTAQAWGISRLGAIIEVGDFFQMPRLELCALALATLGLAWMTMRSACRRLPRLIRLLNPPVPAFDWLVLAMLVLATCGLAVEGLLPGLAHDLDITNFPPQLAHPLAGAGAWMLLGILGLNLLLGLREREAAGALHGLVVLGFVGALVWAGSFGSETATVRAVCWGLSIYFLAATALSCFRAQLASVVARAGVGSQLQEFHTQSARGWLLILTVVPVAFLSVTSLANTAVFWYRLDLNSVINLDYYAGAGSLILSLAIVLMGQIGNAIRERSPGYAFGAGLILNLFAAAWYLHSAALATGRVEPIDWTRLIQFVALAAAVWSLLWLVSRRWVGIQAEGEKATARLLMSLQISQPVMANGLILLVGVVLIITGFELEPGFIARIGSPLGWCVLTLTIAAVVERAWQAGRFAAPWCCASVGLAIVVLAGCSVSAWGDHWAYRTLLLGWASYLPALVGLAWLIDQKGDRAGIFRSALRPGIIALWVRFIGILVVVLGLQSALQRDDYLWAAAAIAITGVSGAVMAIWRQRENWAFLAGLAVNLAATLVIWQASSDLAIEAWRIQFVQVNLLVAATVALLWVGARRLIYRDGETNWRAAPFLLTQVAVTFGLNFLLLLGPGLWLVASPSNALPGYFEVFAGPVSWSALILPAMAACWYASLNKRPARGHVLMVTGLLLGVLTALTIGVRYPDQSWVAYHTLMATWTGLGLLLIAAEPLARMIGQDETPFSPFPYVASLLVFGTRQFRIWSYVVGSLVLMLAFRIATSDPQGPYWSSGSVLAVAFMAGATAIRMRSQEHVYLSGVLLAVASFLAWLVWNPLPDAHWLVTSYSLGYTLLLTFAIGSALWTIIEFTLRSGTPAISLRASQTPAFAHTAAWLAAGLGLVLLGLSLPARFQFTGPPIHWLLPASALAVLLLAFLTLLWDESADHPLAGLYGTAILIFGFGLQLLALEPRLTLIYATTGLALFVLAASGLGELGAQAGDLWSALRIKHRPNWPQSWFLVSQYTIGTLLVVASLWIVLAFDGMPARAMGPASVGLLALASILSTRLASASVAALLRTSTLWLGVILAVETAWVLLGPIGTAGALHRHAVLLLALATMTVLESVWLPRLLASFPDWAQSARRTGPVLLAATLFVLITLLGHEGAFFDRATKHTPLALWETLAVAAAFLGLMATAICFALDPARDIYRVSERRRPGYVYLAEFLLLLLFLHVRLNIPELFGGVLTKYWPLVVMVIAFAGVGLSELFERRKLSVLAQPLQRTGMFMPLLPLLAFWVRPPEVVYDFMTSRFPGSHAALDPLMRMEPNFGKYAMVWFTLGLLYSWLANIKQSFKFGLLAALAGNFGLWALLFNADLHFFSHPQMWMIPLALILLVSEHLNRRELGPRRSTALRYLALTMIYVSSTADMFLAWGENPYLPIVLALLCVAGVLAGILLRVTAFLYLGTSFLCVVVFSMIWHAAVDHRQMWLWWACGIGLGALIFGLFAVFEKRRDDILKLIEDIKTWD